MKTAFNLLPPEYAKEQRCSVRRGRIFLVLLAAAVVCVGQYFFFAFRRLDFLQRRYDAVTKHYDEAAARLSKLSLRWAGLAQAGRRWGELTEAAKAPLPALELLSKVVAALPEGARLAHIIADTQRCHIDMFLPEGADPFRIVKKLGKLRGYSPFTSGGRSAGRQGTPLYRFDAVREERK